VRRQRGGAAVVLGALSPRTRNAQVALYQSGDVDFLVATDAIGMGLNMDVDHVAFASHEKFDGRGHRPLRADETGQIAGRAGRYMNDGTFGVTGECEPFDNELVSRIESHRYDPVKVLQWRNDRLDFQSIAALLESLEAPPPAINGSGRGLVRARPASDAVALAHLAREDDVQAIATSREMVRLLWDVCQLPDFRKLSADDHARLVKTIFLFRSQGAIPNDWMARQIARLDVAEGDVATLSGRLAQIRTFTYAAHRAGWTEDAARWQGETRAVEDRLSDALHERLTQRFIDRRTSVLIKHLREDEISSLTLDESGDVAIGGEAIGRLDGFRFTPDPRAGDMGTIHARTLRAAAMKGLEGEYLSRAARLSASPDADITLSEHGKLWWDGAIVARLVAGATPLAPRLELIADEWLKGVSRTGVQNRLEDWVTARIQARLEPLLALARAAQAKAGSDTALPALARGLAHQLTENFAALKRDTLHLPEKLGPLLRSLRPFGVWFGRRHVYLPKLLRPDAASLLALLWGVWTRQTQIPGAPAPGLTSFEIAAEPEGFLNAAGFAKVGARAIRYDMLDRLEEELEKAAIAGQGAEASLPKLVSFLGAGNDEGKEVLAALGWRMVGVKDAPAVWRKARDKRRRREPSMGRPDSPFAGLAELMGGK
jgi:ATP-dependent RNA helicase SUPV3L1/SUV3